MDNKIIIEDKLRKFMRSQWQDRGIVKIENLEVLLGGWSKKTWSFDTYIFRKGEEKSSGTKIPMILRLNNDESNAILPNSRKNEQRVINLIGKHTDIPVPKVYFVTAPEVFGCEAMILERVEGIKQPTSLFQKDSDPELQEKLAISICENLATLHTMDPNTLNPDGFLDDPGNDGINVSNYRNYIDSRTNLFLKRLEKFEFSPLPSYYDMFLHLKYNSPIKELPLRVVHGEVNPTNFIYLYKGHISSMIDWELAHIGDPREDLGWFLFFEKATGTQFMDSIKSKDGGFLGYYNELTGFDVTLVELAYFTNFGIANVFSEVFLNVASCIRGEIDVILNRFMFQFFPTISDVHMQSLNYASGERVCT